MLFHGHGKSIKAERSKPKFSQETVKSARLNQPRASLAPQSVKSLPAVQETQVQFLGQEDPQEKGMQSNLVFLPGEFHGQKRLVGSSPWSRKELDMIEC